MKKKFIITEISSTNGSISTFLLLLTELLVPLGIIGFLITGYCSEIVGWYRFFLWLALMIGMCFIMKFVPIIGLLYSIFATLIYFLLIWYGTSLLEIEVLKWGLRLLLFLFIGITMYMITMELFWNNIKFNRISILKPQKIIDKFKITKNEKSSIPQNSLIYFIQKITILNVYIASSESDIIVKKTLTTVHFLTQDNQLLLKVSRWKQLDTNFEDIINSYAQKYYLHTCKQFYCFDAACLHAKKHIPSKQIFDAQLDLNSSSQKFYELQKKFTAYILPEEEKGAFLIADTQQLLSSDFICVYSYYQILRNIGELNTINNIIEKNIQNYYNAQKKTKTEKTNNNTGSKTSSNNDKSNSQDSNYENNYYSHNKSTDNHRLQIDTLFSGCTDKASITKRYRQLMKIYHTDNPNGDKDMTQQIQTTYQKIINQI